MLVPASLARFICLGLLLGNMHFSVRVLSRLSVLLFFFGLVFCWGEDGVLGLEEFVLSWLVVVWVAVRGVSGFGVSVCGVVGCVLGVGV